MAEIKLKAKYVFQKDDERRDFVLKYIAKHLKDNLERLSKHRWGFNGFACFVNLERSQSKPEGQEGSK